VALLRIVVVVEDFGDGGCVTEEFQAFAAMFAGGRRR
jgi:hypothetical protein